MLDLFLGLPPQSTVVLIDVADTSLLQFSEGLLAILVYAFMLSNGKTRRGRAERKQTEYQKNSAQLLD